MTKKGRDAVRAAVRGAKQAVPLPREGWRNALAKEDRGAPPPTLANVLIALRQAPELSSLFAHDQMLGLTMVMNEPPGHKAELPRTPRPLSEADASAVQEWIQRNGLPQASRDVLRQAIDLVARERAFHPVREYLQRLKWDHTPRLGKWLSYYLGAEPCAYTVIVGKRFLIGMVARVMEPGCKAEHMLVLEGPQGIGKSAACAVLGGAWFSDSLPDLVLGKEVSQHLAGKWLIEIAELSATSRASAEALKSFLSRTTERYRPPYGRDELIVPRQCVFIGTTNGQQYLRDDTGARRFWPVRCGQTIDLNALRQDVDQLFAEAFVAYRNGERWWPDATEIEHLTPQQDARREEDPWEIPILRFLTGVSGGRTTIPEIAAQLDLSVSRLDASVNHRIAAILRREGWADARTKKGRHWKQGGNP